MSTPLYPTFEKRIMDDFKSVQRRQVDPWAFFSSGDTFTIKTFDDRTIGYGGIRFEGSPQTVFWSRYIEPFLEDLVVRQIADAVKEARERGVDGRLLLAEVEGLLLAGCNKIFARMADIDRRLIGRGFPNSVPLRSAKREIEGMRCFIERRILAEQQMWRSKSRLELWYEHNKFWVWAIPIFGAVVGAIVKVFF